MDGWMHTLLPKRPVRRRPVRPRRPHFTADRDRDAREALKKELHDSRAGEFSSRRKVVGRGGVVSVDDGEDLMTVGKSATIAEDKVVVDMGKNERVWKQLGWMSRRGKVRICLVPLLCVRRGGGVEEEPIAAVVVDTHNPANARTCPRTRPHRRQGIWLRTSKPPRKQVASRGQRLRTGLRWRGPHYRVASGRALTTNRAAPRACGRPALRVPFAR